MGTVDAVEWACVLCGRHIQMTERVEQWTYIKFCINLEHSSAETTGMIQEATGDWQLHHDNPPAHALHLMQSFLVKLQITQVLSPATAQIWSSAISGFSQN